MRLIALLVTAGALSTTFEAQAAGDALDLGAMIAPVPQCAIFEDPNWFTWGASVVLGDDGRYHMYYARWPKSLEMKGWLKDSEIAYAVADKPLGPYRHVTTVLKGRGKERWDARTAHNPTIKRFDGKYYLYYVATSDNNHCDDDWMNHVYGQRIGVAVADKPEGPWQTFDKPLLEPQPDTPARNYVTNPSVTKGPDGKYYMMFKTNDPPPNSVHTIALADSPTGPFVVQNKTLLDGIGAEDPYVWYDSQRRMFYAIAKDMYGRANGVLSLVLVESANGLDWTRAANPLVSKLEFTLESGETRSLAHLERPQLLLDETGQPSVLFCAAAYTNPFQEGGHTFNVHLPLKQGD